MIWLLPLLAPITPPAGWTLDKDLAPPPPAQRFGGSTTKLSIYAYRAPTPGAVLYVNRAEAEVKDERDKIATIELDEPRNAMKRATGAPTAGSQAKIETDTQRWDPAKKQLESEVRWSDGTVTEAHRILVAADATRMVAVSGQCVLAADVAADVAKACSAALATLDAELPGRVDLTIVAGASEPEPPPKPIPDTLTDGRHVSLPPMQLDPPKPEPDRRPVYVGGGLVVFAALFYWNRRRRERFEKEPKRDEDGDDLHAAAKAEQVSSNQVGADDGDKE